MVPLYCNCAACRDGGSYTGTTPHNSSNDDGTGGTLGTGVVFTTNRSPYLFSLDIGDMLSMNVGREPPYPFLLRKEAWRGDMWLFWVGTTRRMPRDTGCRVSRPQSRAKKSTWRAIPRGRAAQRAPGHAPRAQRNARAKPGHQRRPHQRARQPVRNRPVTRLIEKCA